MAAETPYPSCLSHSSGGLVQTSAHRVVKSRKGIIPRTVSVFKESASPLAATAPVCCVETEDTDDASESPPPVMLPSKLAAVELDLFFLGKAGRILPGNSVRRSLCSRLKSP